MTFAMNEANHGSARLCEVEVWDGGEHVYCHAPASDHDAITRVWLCESHAAMLAGRAAWAEKAARIEENGR